MPGGRPPKPKDLHELDGTYRSDRHSVSAVSGSILSEPPPPPKGLSKLAKMEWITVTEWMCSRGILSATDLSLIGVYCNEVAVYYECQKVLTKCGYTVEYVNLKGDKKIMIRPEVARQKEAAKLALQYATQFGYTPSARVKLNIGAVKVVTGLDKLKGRQPNKAKDNVIDI